MFRQKYGFIVQLKMGMSVEEFEAAVLPRLHDRSDWSSETEDWEGHPKNRWFIFEVITAFIEPIVIIDGQYNPISAWIEVTFGHTNDAADFAAFAGKYATKICNAAFQSGAVAVSYYEENSDPPASTAIVQINPPSTPLAMAVDSSSSDDPYAGDEDYWDQRPEGRG